MKNKTPTIMGDKPRIEALRELMALARLRTGKIVLAPGAAAELQAQGIPMPADSREAKPEERTDSVVCADYDLIRPLIYPDNMIASCGVCRRPVQHRPRSMRASSRFLCVQCATSEMRSKL